ncbi:hypothetical protein BST92_00295 [Nonlabens arenilitoris]|uniref:Uncharacterized protein n=2 Tax=Nonlabens arenilitoris TaxID=1217969 RepID=A0A2S7U858_9FLAO|nr:hypothetical protein BST92_00295 [Nonlabens arenilitoris]
MFMIILKFKRTLNLILMKNLLFLLGIILLSSATAVQFEGCECGDHETGITTYNVGEGEGCCSGEAGVVGFITSYEYSEGVWRVSGQSKITGSAAQSACCPDA